MVSQLQQNHPVALCVFGFRYCSWLWAFPRFFFFLFSPCVSFFFFLFLFSFLFSFFFFPSPLLFLPSDSLGCGADPRVWSLGPFQWRLWLSRRKLNHFGRDTLLPLLGWLHCPYLGFCFLPHPSFLTLCLPSFFSSSPPLFFFFFFLPLPFFPRCMLMPIGAARCDWA